MTKFKISYPIDGLHDVIPKKEDSLQVGQVLFHYRGDERVGTITLDSNDQSQAEITALQDIDKSLGKVCFGYNTEALINKDGLYAVDITTDPQKKRICRNFAIRWSYLGEKAEDALHLIESIKNNKRDLLDLAIAYYRLGYYNNPLRLECFFSCLTVLIRDITGSDHVFTSDLKKWIKSIVKKRDSQFDENKFEQDWRGCYAEERCSIAHGRGSKLINISKSFEHEKIVNIVHYWTRAVLYDFIKTNQVYMVTKSH